VSKSACNDEICYCDEFLAHERHTVDVPAEGEFLVRDGKVIPVLETELMEPGTEDWAWRVWTDPQGEDDE
jgi:hypothetical protein